MRRVNCNTCGNQYSSLCLKCLYQKVEEQHTTCDIAKLQDNYTFSLVPKNGLHYKIGDTVSRGYRLYKIVKVRLTKARRVEYKLDNGMWYTEHQMLWGSD